MVNKKDMLDEIYTHQLDLQTKLGNIKKMNSSPQMKQQFINQMLLACHEEVTEIMRETAYKNPEFMPFGWKKNQTFNNELFKEEIIDLIHFVMNLCIVADMKPKEIYERYINKNKENHKRQEVGY
ncbi:hypothetical protein LCGC14_2905150 [marine sediment metagenome]|uniref:NTP pyrophosphohydrolase MazG putative catalytic core domain-containing protein n=1 Tax=marine sediment metagenome TaxID=412755 RepID=A0A0F8YF39_9ZZZZ